MKKKGNILTIELENYYLANTIKSSNGVFKTSKMMISTMGTE